MLAFLSLAFSLLWMVAGPTDVAVFTLPKGEITVQLDPSGKAALRREGSITHVRVELDRIGPPSAQGAAFRSYVVWAVSPEGIFENIGEMSIEKDKARIDTASRFEQIGLLITAEPHYMVDRPSAAIAFRTLPPKKEDVRNVAVPVQIGAYDYSSIQAPAGVEGPTVVAQARFAYQIAKNAQADRFAVSEFRRAKITLDTMEEMVTRTGPPEIVSQVANEVIRRSQQAVTVARERQTVVSLENARNEVAALQQLSQSLNSRIGALTEQQAAATAQVQKLQTDVATGTRDAQRITQERDQATARERAATQELSDVKRRQQDLQTQLVLPLREDFVDAKTSELTLSGREALSRLRGIAEALAGKITLEGPASDPLFEAARQYLIQSGIPQDRITLKR